jgi:hypothetical protein
LIRAIGGHAGCDPWSARPDLIRVIRGPMMVVIRGLRGPDLILIRAIGGPMVVVIRGLRAPT